MNTTLTIQEKLKDLRVEHGLTLEQLADQTGLSKSALGKYENISFTQSRLTDAVSVILSELLSYEHPSKAGRFLFRQLAGR